jgi:hypothetical protein
VSFANEHGSNISRETPVDMLRSTPRYIPGDRRDSLCRIVAHSEEDRSDSLCRIVSHSEEELC